MDFSSRNSSASELSLPRQRKPLEPLSRPASPGPSREVIVHAVQPTDTFAALTLHYGIKLPALRAANRLWPGDSIHSRKRLLIPIDECDFGASARIQNAVRDSDGNIVVEYGHKPAARGPAPASSNALRKVSAGPSRTPGAYVLPRLSAEYASESSSSSLASPGPYPGPGHGPASGAAPGPHSTGTYSPTPSPYASTSALSATGATPNPASYLSSTNHSVFDDISEEEAPRDPPSTATLAVERVPAAALSFFPAQTDPSPPGSAIPSPSPSQRTFLASAGGPRTGSASTHASPRTGSASTPASPRTAIPPTTSERKGSAWSALFGKGWSAWDISYFGPEEEEALALEQRRTAQIPLHRKNSNLKKLI